MFLAHLPAGYITTKLSQKHFHFQGFLFWGMLGSIIPDFDLAYFYLFDHSQHLHHEYLFHMPYFWFIIAGLSFGVLGMWKQKEYLFASTLFFGNVFLHLFLDTLTGGIAWLAPWKLTPYTLVTVPAVHDYRVWNFVLHWTFGTEIVILIWAMRIYFQGHKKSRA